MEATRRHARRAIGMQENQRPADLNQPSASRSTWFRKAVELLAPGDGG